MKSDKFLVFLESLVTEDNKAVIDVIKQGFNTLEEAYNSPDSMMDEESTSYKANPQKNVKQRIQLMSNMADRSNHDTILDLLDYLYGRLKANDKEGFVEALRAVINESKRDNARNIYSIAIGLAKTLKI